jgi:O-methyltransferase involved in polyketide biosynthesis
MTSVHTKPVSVAALHDIPATLLIPLWYRAAESARRDAIVRDPHAQRIARAVDFDFTPLCDAPGGRLTQVGVANRTLLIDRAVRGFLGGHPGATVLNIGCGLDARFLRLDDGLVRWIDLDVAESIALRRRFFAELTPRYRMVVGSLLEDDWIGALDIDAAAPLLVLIEGTLMYFSEADVRRLIVRLIDRLPVRAFCLEVAGPLMLRRVHPILRRLGMAQRFGWGTRNFTALAAWHPRLTLAAVGSIWDLNRRRFGALGLLPLLVPGWGSAMGSSVVSLRVAPAA